MNGIVIVDKPEGWTSNDVVCKLKGVLHERRVGHGGTLDPMATGVLPVFVGRATRAVPFCENADKEYEARLTLGVVTDTQDATGRVLETHDARSVTLADVQSVLSRFTGDIEQVPPMYSAVKMGGKKLYELARKGVEVERKARPVTVFALSAREAEQDFALSVVCSKGTYIRTLCHDIGRALGCGGVMAALRRTRAGRFTLADALPLEEVIRRADEGDLSFLRGTDSLFSEFPACTADEAQEARCRTGTDWTCVLPDGRYRVYGQNGEFLMLGCVTDGVMTTVRSFFEV